MKKTILLMFILLVLLIGSSCKKEGGPDFNGNPSGTPNECIHEHKTWYTIMDSTCETKGSKVQMCDDCGEKLTTAFIPLKSHDIVIDKRIDATCENDGLTEGSHCKTCGTVIVKQEKIPLTGHGYSLSEELSNDEYFVYVCECGSSYNIENTTTKECTNHINSEWIIIEDSTCAKLGSKKQICTNCEVVLAVESIELKEHTPLTIEGVEPKCGVTGLTEGTICKVCEEVLVAQDEIEALTHDYVIINTVAPTKTETGYNEYECRHCKDKYIVEIEKLGNYNPDEPTVIKLSDNEIIVTNDNSGVVINGNEIVINLAGEYDIFGTISEGHIIVELLEEERATLNLQGINLTSSTHNPIYIASGDEVDISAKSGTENYIYDKRSVSGTDDTGAAIYAKVDLDIKGKGKLHIESTYNNGIGTTKDLKIKNLELYVNVPNNAIKGNDSITIESGTITAISSSGDSLKTENSDISDSGKQRGIIHIIDGTLNLYAACDGIDASYEVIIDGGEINIYTENYSSYSGDVTITDSSKMYLRVSSRLGLTNYTFSGEFIREDGTSEIVNGTLDSNPSSRYYKFNIPTGAKYAKFYAYSSSQTQGQTVSYSYATDQITISTTYDTYYVASKSGTKLNGSWTNYSTSGGGPGGGPGGPGGGMQEGNPDSSLYSCKGIKADNNIVINGGKILIKSHDDGIHTNSDVLLETGSYGVANIEINGGEIEITTDDDGIHADGTFTINGGNVVINKAYEGVEGSYIYFKGGTTEIKSSDDGINAKTTLYFQGGVVYLDASGDGIDSNGSVYMSGGVVFALGPTNGGNGVIDIGDRGYTFSFTGGLLLAIGCSGMDVAPTGTSGNTVNASRTTSSLNSYLTVTSNGEIVAVLKVTKSNQTYRVFAYNNATYPSTTLTQTTTTSVDLVNGLYYVK